MSATKFAKCRVVFCDENEKVSGGGAQNKVIPNAAPVLLDVALRF